MKQHLDKAYWTQRWENTETGWDVGSAVPAITDFFKTLEDKNVSVLIPGCGNAYEASALWKQGYRDITIVEIVSAKAQELQEQFAGTSIQVVNDDFFNLTGMYDYIVEHTFFCSLLPEDRAKYVTQVYNLLKNDGLLVGLLFSSEFQKQGPPFGGASSQYQILFSACFSKIDMQPCYNSIKPRSGNELFIRIAK